MDEYIVKPGDNLWKIAQMFRMDPQQLIEANQDRFKDPNLIRPGDRVALVPRRGIPSSAPLDNLGGGANCSGGSCGPLAMINKISPFNLHPANQILGLLGASNPGLPPPMNAMLSAGQAIGNQMNPADDAIQPVIPEEILPFLKGAGGLGAIAGMAYKFPEMIAALAKRAPSMAGRGAGKMPELASNVRPVGGNPQSVARTLLANTPEAKMSRALQNPKTIPERQLGNGKWSMDPRFPGQNAPRNPYASEQYPDTPTIDIRDFIRRMTSD